MKLLARPYRPLPLRSDEEALIEAIITWAAEERRIHGHLPDLPSRFSTVGGDVVLTMRRPRRRRRGPPRASFATSS